jgi:hypothetical protein
VRRPTERHGEDPARFGGARHFSVRSSAACAACIARSGRKPERRALATNAPRRTPETMAEVNAAPGIAAAQRIAVHLPGTRRGAGSTAGVHAHGTTLGEARGARAGATACWAGRDRRPRGARGEHVALADALRFRHEPFADEALEPDRRRDAPPFNATSRTATRSRGARRCPPMPGRPTKEAWPRLSAVRGDGQLFRSPPRGSRCPHRGQRHQAATRCSGNQCRETLAGEDGRDQRASGDNAAAQQLLDRHSISRRSGSGVPRKSQGTAG